MKQRYTKFSCVILAFLLLFLMTTPAMASDDIRKYSINTTSTVSGTIKNNIAAADMAYTAILDSFRASSSNTFTREGGNYTVEGIYAAGFPDYYAGAYINQNGNLVVLLTESLSTSEIVEAKQHIIQIVGKTNILFSSATHSYSELVTTMSNIPSLTVSSTEKNVQSTIYGYGINDYRNQIDVFTDNPDYFSSMGTSQRSIVPLNFIYQGSGDSATSFPCGSALGKNYNSNTFSVGYRASRYGVEGFVTCGHALRTSATGDSIFCGGVNIGTFNRSYYQFSGNTDAAFIELRDTTQYDISTAIGTTGRTISTSGTVSKAPGSTVYMYGKTSRSQQGVVVSSSFSCNVNDYDSNGNILHSVAITDLAKIDYVPSGGDSGGIVYAFIGAGQYYTAGIYCSAGSNYGTYCKVININSAFNLSMR